MSSGIPVKLLHEAEGHTVTCELKGGELYRGKLVEAEDNMNCQLADITFTDKAGHVSHLDSVYIRGSKMRFLQLPEMLKNAPMFKAAKKAAAAANPGRQPVRAGVPKRGGTRK